jgi:hypothetical protein
VNNIALFTEVYNNYEYELIYRIILAIHHIFLENSTLKILSRHLKGMSTLMQFIALLS